jgi:prevent-host-death family protein
VATVSIGELKAHLNEIIRRVDESREPVEVTRSGKVIVRIEPVNRTVTGDELVTFWERHKRLVEGISKQSTGEPNPVVAAHELRRNVTPDEWVPAYWRRNE